MCLILGLFCRKPRQVAYDEGMKCRGTVKWGDKLGKGVWMAKVNRKRFCLFRSICTAGGSNARCLGTVDPQVIGSSVEVPGAPQWRQKRLRYFSHLDRGLLWKLVHAAVSITTFGESELEMCVLGEGHIA